MDKKRFYTYLIETYGAEPEFLWAKFPEYAVFRHSGSRKWFAAVMTVPRNRLGLEEDGQIDIVDLKCDPAMVGALRREPGFFPAYHMNKDHWITAALDGSVAEDHLKTLVEMSRPLFPAKRERPEGQ